MNSLIKQVLDLDLFAQKRLEEARSQRETDIAAIDEQARQEREKLSQRCRERIEKTYLREKEFCEETLVQIADAEKVSREKLEKRFSEMKEDWLSDIIRSTVQ